MPEDLKLPQIGSSQLPPPFRGLHSHGVRKRCQIIFACYFRKSSISNYQNLVTTVVKLSLLCNSCGAAREEWRVCMCVCTRACVCVHFHFMTLRCLWLHACMYACLYSKLKQFCSNRLWWVHMCMCACMHACMYVCVCSVLEPFAITNCTEYTRTCMLQCNTA